MGQPISTNKLYLLGLFGNIAEWYDFSIYSFLAVALGEIFFASSTRQVALIKAFAIFSITYLVRPIGSICFGYIGDKFGRRISLRMSLLLMAVPAVLIGILPTYDNIGITATISLAILRIIQGFAVGGELPGILCYVYESAPSQKKKFFCSFSGVAGPMLGMFLGSSIVTALYTILPKNDIHNWGWRVPFWISILVLFFILHIRKDLEETAEFSSKKNQWADKSYNKELWDELLLHKKSFFQAISIWVFLEISFYLLLIWMPSYISVFLNFAADQSFLSTSIGVLLYTAAALTVGYFAANIQPKKILLISIIAIILPAYPLFLLLQLKTLSMIMLTQSIFSLANGALTGVAAYIIGDLFSTKIRCISMSISIAIASGVFGGLAPTICSYLINQTGYLLWPVFFLLVTGLIAIAGVLSFES